MVGNKKVQLQIFPKLATVAIFIGKIPGYHLKSVAPRFFPSVESIFGFLQFSSKMDDRTRGDEVDLVGPRPGDVRRPPRHEVGRHRRLVHRVIGSKRLPWFFFRRFGSKSSSRRRTRFLWDSEIWWSHQPLARIKSNEGKAQGCKRSSYSPSLLNLQATGVSVGVLIITVVAERTQLSPPPRYHLKQIKIHVRRVLPCQSVASRKVPVIANEFFSCNFLSSLLVRYPCFLEFVHYVSVSCIMY